MNEDSDTEFSHELLMLLRLKFSFLDPYGRMISSSEIIQTIVSDSNLFLNIFSPL